MAQGTLLVRSIEKAGNTLMGGRCLAALHKARLVLRTANGSSVEFAEIIGLEALKPPTDFCRRVLVARQIGRLRIWQVG